MCEYLTETTDIFLISNYFTRGSFMEKNFLGITTFGVFHIYFSSGNIYIRKFDKNKWSRCDLVLSSATSDFDVYCTDTSLFILGEKTCGNLVLTEYTHRKRKQFHVLTSSRGTPSVSGIRLFYSAGNLNIFYILHHDNKKLLVRQAAPFTNAPAVIDVLSNEHFGVFSDEKDRITIYYEKSGKPSKCIISQSGAHDITPAAFHPLAALALEGRKQFLLRDGDRVMFGESIESATAITDLSAKDAVSSLFVYKGKIYVVLINGTSFYIFVSEDGGKSFKKTLPQIVTNAPELKTLSVRKMGFDICLPCNAERGYIRSMVIPLEQIISLSSSSGKESIVKQISDLEQKIAKLKKELEKY